MRIDFLSYILFITINADADLCVSGYEVTLQKMANFLSESLCNERIVNPGKIAAELTIFVFLQSTCVI